MLSDHDVELAHPEAFDFVFGNLPPDKRAEFNHHLTGCRYCQSIIDDYREIGQVIKSLPPHVEPPADLEHRTVAAMTAALTGSRARADRRSDPEDRAATRVHLIPELQPTAEDETRVQPRPQLQPTAEDETRVQPRPQLQPTAEPQARPSVTPMVTRLPVWRRYRGRLTAVVAAAAIIAAAIVIPLSLSRGGATPAQATAVIPLHATTAAKVFGVGTATARATARQAGESWTFTLTVRGLKVLPGNDFYECWWAAPGSTKLHPMLATGGSFVVGNSGSATVTMTTGVDPTQQFRTMEITAESPGNGTQLGPVLLTGQTL